MSALTQRIVSEIEAASEPVQAEVLDFVLFVKARAGIAPESGSSGRIQRSPGVCGGEACVGMTRIAVWMLEEARRAGVGTLGLLVEPYEVESVQGEHDAVLFRGECQDLIVRDLLICASDFVGCEDIMSEPPEFLDDTFGEVLVGVERGHQAS